MPSQESPESAQTLSSRTTPTWEMELLISGATVFGLLQSPAPLDRWLFGLYNSSTTEVASLVLPLWLYLKFSVFALILTFIAHLCLRGYWVALAGLYSVYPRGIRWENLGNRLGPHYMRSSQEAVGELPDIIERADNRASRVFGVGFGLATAMLLPIVLVSIALVALRIPGLFGAHAVTEWLAPVMFAALLLLVLPFMAALWWDRKHGSRIPDDSAQGRRLRRMFRFFAALGFGRSNNTLLTLFATNEGGRRTQVYIGIATAIALTLLMVQGIADRVGLDAGDYRGLPRAAAGTADVVLPGHYRNERGDGVTMVPLPHIPGPVVRGPYLALFVPYLPTRHDEAMQRACPAAMADTGDGGARKRLDCLARIHAVRLDGALLKLRFDAAEDPDTGQRGMLAMIPVQGLAPGRHELVLREASHRPKSVAMTRLYRIPFWR